LARVFDLLDNIFDNGLGYFFYLRLGERLAIEEGLLVYQKIVVVHFNLEKSGKLWRISI
jgi:hypothetical protein